MEKIIAVVLVVWMAFVVNAKPKTSTVDQAVDLIAYFEGFREKPYTCPGGRKTIGYGFTASKYTSRKSMAKTEARSILRELVEADMIWLETRSPNLTEPQKVAVASFIYNFGRNAYLNSTFRKRLNAGKVEEAKAELLKWNKAGGKVLKGLQRRRKVEAALL